jgi:hypothetical protein
MTGKPVGVAIDVLATLRRKSIAGAQHVKRQLCERAGRHNDELPVLDQTFTGENRA